MKHNSTKANFLSQLISAQLTKDYCYLIYKWVPGISLNSLLTRTIKLSLSEIRFFAAGILAILSMLHKNKIIMRDLKPDSFKIGYDGYPVLYKAGAAKVNIRVNHSLECKTILGTPHYMAPEIISRKRYSHTVDIWSFGVTLYEMICGSVPFGEGIEDPYEIYHAILGVSQIQFPPIFNKENFKGAKKLIKMFLNRDPTQRMPKDGFQDLFNHEFFWGFDFDDYWMKDMQPPSKDWIGMRWEEKLVRTKIDEYKRKIKEEENSKTKKEPNITQVKHFQFYRPKGFLSLNLSNEK